MATMVKIIKIIIVTIIATTTTTQDDDDDNDETVNMMIEIAIDACENCRKKEKEREGRE